MPGYERACFAKRRLRLGAPSVSPVDRTNRVPGIRAAFARVEMTRIHQRQLVVILLERFSVSPFGRVNVAQHQPEANRIERTGLAPLPPVQRATHPEPLDPD